MSSFRFIVTDDSQSLWNYTISPGWSEDDVRIFRLSIMKFGVGKWKDIIDSGCLPGKTPSQLSLQCQRLLGQQSLGEYMSIQLDPSKVFEMNSKKTEPLTIKQRKELVTKNREIFQLPKDVIDNIVLPDRRDDIKMEKEEKLQYLMILKKRKQDLLLELERRKNTSKIEEQQDNRFSKLYDFLSGDITDPKEITFFNNNSISI